MPPVMTTRVTHSPFRRALSLFGESAETQRRHSAAASHTFRAVGAIVGMVVGLGLVVFAGWSGGYALVTAMLLILVDAEGHRRGLIRTGPFISLSLEIFLYAFSFALLGLSGPSLGAPLAYVAVAAVLLLAPLPGLVAVLTGVMAFGFVPALRVTYDPGLEPAVVRGLGLTINLLFTGFIVAIVWSVLLTLVSQSVRRQRTITYQQALSECSHALLDHRDRAALTRACEALLPATRADYVYIEEVYLGPDGRDFTRVVAQADATPEWNPGTDPFMGGPVDAVPTSTAALVQGQSIVIHTRDLMGEERRLYEADGLKTEILVPIMDAGAWIGTIGFVEYRHEREWEASEIEAIETAAGMVSSHYSRARAYQALVESLEAKDRFVASVSHELRTPLSVVLGLATELAENLESFEPDEVRSLSGLVARHATEVSAIVEDLLVSARMEAGTLTVQPAVIDPAQLVTEVLDDGWRRGGSNPIEVRGSASRAWADPLRVRQVLRNLLTNARRYGGPRVWVELAENELVATFRICDDGNGIDDKDLERIFEPYVSAHDPKGKPTAVGLGLSVARQLARLMDGDIRIVPADHTIFELTLPAIADSRA